MISLRCFRDSFPKTIPRHNNNTYICTLQFNCFGESFQWCAEHLDLIILRFVGCRWLPCKMPIRRMCRNNAVTLIVWPWNLKHAISIGKYFTQDEWVRTHILLRSIIICSDYRCEAMWIACENGEFHFISTAPDFYCCTKEHLWRHIVHDCGLVLGQWNFNLFSQRCQIGANQVVRTKRLGGFKWHNNLFSAIFLLATNVLPISALQQAEVHIHCDVLRTQRLRVPLSKPLLVVLTCIRICGGKAHIAVWWGHSDEQH